MPRLLDIPRPSRIGAVALGALFALAAWTALPGSAQARVFVGVGVGVPFPGYYPYPCCAYPYPYAPYPPPVYYPPPPPPYFPPPAAYAPPPAAPAPTTTASITYTGKPAFTNAAGQTCREFKTPQNALGTACRGADGQWRVQN